MDYGLALNIVVLAALAATLVYAHRLSKQFTAMQADRKAFEQLITSLNLAAARAEAATQALKEAATQGGDQLQDKINKARAIADELEIMVQAGDNLAHRLQGLAEQGRKANAPAGAMNNLPAADAAPAAADDGAPVKQPRSRAERELLEALKAKQQS